MTIKMVISWRNHKFAKCTLSTSVEQFHLNVCDRVIVYLTYEADTNRFPRELQSDFVLNSIHVYLSKRR